MLSGCSPSLLTSTLLSTLVSLDMSTTAYVRPTTAAMMSRHATPRTISTRLINFLSRVAVISLWMTSIISEALMMPSPLASAAWRRCLSVEVSPGASSRSAKFKPFSEAIVRFLSRS